MSSPRLADAVAQQSQGWEQPAGAPGLRLPEVARVAREDSSGRDGRGGCPLQQQMLW